MKALVRSLIVLALIGAAGFVAVKMRGPTVTGGGAPPPPARMATTGLGFVKTTQEVAVAADATTATVDFPFENKTDKILTIAKVEKNCSCAEVQVSGGKLSYAPGEQGVIRAFYELGNLMGRVEKPFMLWLAGDPDEEPSHTLTSCLIIPVLVELDRKTLQWTLDGPGEPAKIDIRGRHSEPIRVLAATSSSDDFKVELKPVEEGRHYELWVTPANTANPGLASIRMETDCAIPRWKVLQAFATVRAPTANIQTPSVP